jgi:hypothetical protein
MVSFVSDYNVHFNRPGFFEFFFNAQYFASKHDTGLGIELSRKVGNTRR